MSGKNVTKEDITKGSIIDAIPDMISALNDLNEIGEAANIAHNLATLFDFWQDDEHATQLRKIVSILHTHGDRARAALDKALPCT